MIQPRINIYDVDQTTITGQAEDIYDVAFVPGFSNKNFDDMFESADPDPLSGTSLTEPTGTPKNGHYWYNTQDFKQFKYSCKEEDIYQATEVGFNTADNDWSILFNTASHKVWEAHMATGYPLENVPDYDNRPLSPSEGDHYVQTGVSCTLYTYTGGNWVPDSVNLYYLVQSLNTGLMESWVRYSVSNGDNTYNLYYFDEKSAGIDAAEYDGTQLSEENRGYMYAEDQGTYTLYKDVLGSGFAYSYTLLNEYDSPISGKIEKFSSYSSFVKAIGDTPVTIWKYIFDGQQDGPAFSALEPFAFAKNESKETTTAGVQNWMRTQHLQSSIIWVDRNWLYAAELLRLGLPVIYYNIAGLDKDKIADLCDTAAGSANALDQAFRALFIDYNGVDDTESVFVQTYAELADRGEYDAKYLTVGAFGIDLDSELKLVYDSDNDNGQFAFKFPFYSPQTLTRKAICFLSDIADYRKNSLVLADALQEQSRGSLVPDDEDSVYHKFDTLVKDGEFANPYNDIIYTTDQIARSGCKTDNTFPWYYATCQTFPNNWAQYREEKNVFVMPGSFAYLKCLATAIQNYGAISWQAIAGVTRALIPDFAGLYTDERLSNAVADAYNKRNDTGINAITNIRPYGYCIWGNRTLVNNQYFADQANSTDGLIASSFVDIMSMVCNINTVAYNACKRLMFEKDNDVLWTRFLQAVSPYLDQLQTGGGLRTYDIKREPSTMRGQLVAKIIIWPIYAVESFDIAIVLRDTDVAVES